MLGLVAYGSDSEGSDDDTPQPQPAAAAKPAPAVAASKPSPFLSLPPPKSSLSLPPPSAPTVPTPSASTPKPPAKKKGPVKILLDLPAPSSSSGDTGPSNAEADGPPRKKPKFSLGGGGGGGGLSGLAAMLPPPKNESVAVKLQKALGGGAAAGANTTSGASVEEGLTEPAEGRTFSTGFVPHRVGKGKKPVPGKTPAPEPAMDFFGLGSVASTSAPSVSLSTSKPLTISSAPTIAEAPPPMSASTYGDPPTPDDPYPGFTQLPSGQWVAKDQPTYDLWVASMAEGEGAAPKGFGEAEIAMSGMVDVDASKTREAWEKRPQATPRPGSEALDKPVAKPAVKLGGRARSRHQLSALLSEAVENRAELEERIAQGRNNRKSAGNKYGF